MTPRLALALSFALAGCLYDVELARAPASPHSARWEPVSSGVSSDLLAITGSGASDLWAVGHDGLALHFDGTSWRSIQTPTRAPLTHAWSPRPNEVWILGTADNGDGLLLRGSAAGLTASPAPGRDRGVPRAIAGRGPDEVYVVIDSNDPMAPSLWRWDGSQWRPEMPPGGRSSGVAAVAASPLGSIWIATTMSEIAERTNGMWSPGARLPPGLRFDGALCVTGDNAAWLTLGAGSVARVRASMWGATLDTQRTRGLWCGASDSVWAVGDGGRTAQWDGARWSERSAGASDLRGVWSDGRGEAWAVGARGVIVHYVP